MFLGSGKIFKLFEIFSKVKIFQKKFGQSDMHFLQPHDWWRMRPMVLVQLVEQNMPTIRTPHIAAEYPPPYLARTL